MKTVLAIALFLMVTSMGLAQNQTVKAFYEGFDENYIFIDNEGESFEFSTVEKTVSKVYNLTNESLTGKAFLVTYSIKTETDEDGDEYEEFHIISLKPIALEPIDD